MLTQLQSKTSKTQSAATLKMVISMIIFGSIGFFSQHTNLPSFELVFIRCLCATLFLGCCWLLSGQFRNEKWNKKDVLQTLACGLFLVFNWVFLFKSFEETSVTVAISVYHLAPVLVLLIGSILYREKLGLKSIVSIIICFLGAVFISDLDISTSLGGFMPSGIAWALAAALFYACTTLLGKGIGNLSPYATTFLQTGLGIFILLPFIKMEAFTYLTIENWVAVTVTGIIHTGIVYLLFFDSLRHLPTKVISILVFLDPAVAILLDTIVTGFRPELLQSVGIILIFSGMALTFIKIKKTSLRRQTTKFE